MKSFSFNPDLLDDLARRKVVLFVGAGASKAAKPRGGGSFKDWAEFLTDACIHIPDAKQKRQILARISNKDYLIASELLKMHLGGTVDTPYLGGVSTGSGNPSTS